MAFDEKRKLFTTNSIGINKKLQKMLICRALLNSCKTCTLRAEWKREEYSFNLWCYPKMLKISYKKIISNWTVSTVNARRPKGNTTTKPRCASLIGHCVTQACCRPELHALRCVKNVSSSPRLEYKPDYLRIEAARCTRIWRGWQTLMTIAVNKPSCWRHVKNKTIKAYPFIMSN